MARYVPKHRRSSYRRDQRRKLGGIAFGVATVFGLSGTYGFVPANLQAGTIQNIQNEIAAPTASPTKTVRRPAFVQIDAIATTSKLIDLGLRVDGKMEVPEVANVAGWFAEGTVPGDKGPAVIVGHVDSHAGPAVFSRLKELVPGDRVRVAMTDGAIVTFAVKRIDEYRKDLFPTEMVYASTGRSELRLITCGGTFDRSVGSYQDNVVVYATRV